MLFSSFDMHGRAVCCVVCHAKAPLRPAGDVFHPKFEIKDTDVSLRALAPCQSLGAFYVAPTPAAQAFLAALAHWVMYTCAIGPAAFDDLLIDFTATALKMR